MGEQHQLQPPPSESTLPAELPTTQSDPLLPPPSPPPPFDPSRMIGIIKRKALIKELASVYHNECLHYCRELLELQNKYEEPFVDLKAPDDSRKETTKPPKRSKKNR
ncbi:hypothetical protein K2173_021826 [Erythroxylum novogranatense]|uniref:Uncharacterized protein n=1 Tax=Erythroxylum novogranatense TaxID=1862640 RepID=A0AAV8T3E6_9ROSI|nr:hypothetical protein K2173_021826 [Erythroxylum novogranatense]